MKRPKSLLSTLPPEIWAITTVALLFRLAFYFHHQLQGWQLQHDPSLYLALADGSKHGVFSMFHPLDIPETTRMPGYPFLIHLLGDLRIVLLVQVLVSSLKVPLMYSLGKRIGLEGRSLLLPLLVIAIAPIDIILAGSLLTESLFSVLLLTAICLLIGRNSIASCILAAFAIALAAYLRPNGLLIGIVIAVLLLADRRFRWRSVIFPGMLLILLLPWMWRNLEVSGKYHLSDSGTVVAAHFHVPDVLIEADDPAAATYRQRLHDLAASTNWADKIEMRRYFDTLENDVRSVFLDHPVAWMKVMLSKTMKILLAPGRGHIGRHFEDAIIERSIVLLSILTSALVAIGILSFIAVIKKADRGHWSMIMVALTIIISGSISAPDARFKDAAMPLLLLIAFWSFQQLRSKYFTRGNAQGSRSV